MPADGGSPRGLGAARRRETGDAPPPRGLAHLTSKPGGRPPTAALPKGATTRRTRVVSSVPPTVQQVDHGGIAAALLTEERAAAEPSRRALVRRSIIGARIAALLAGYLILDQLQVPPPRITPWLFLIVGSLTVLRIKRPATLVIEQVADVALVTFVLIVGHGMLGPFSLFGAATAFSIGAAAGIPGGLAAASLLVFGGALVGLDQPLSLLDAAAAAEAVRTGVPPVGDGFNYTELVGWLSLYPVGAILGGLLGHVLVESRTSQAMLLEANRVLASLERLAVAAPEALSPARVAVAAADQLRRTLDAELAIVLIEREGTLLEVGRHGTLDAGPHVILDRDWQSMVPSAGAAPLEDAALPARLSRQLPALPRWVTVPLRARDRLVGIALVGGTQRPDSRALRAALAEQASEAAVALDNTQLFGRIEHAAAAAERERLASDLHDGVAQQLTHVRFELELLARVGARAANPSELARLARVAARATDDVRSAIRGLRAQALDEGLVPALRSLIKDLDGAGGPDLTLDVQGAAELDGDTTAELYRIVQEALSNAMRHSEAKTIQVSMDVIDETLVIVVDDDGRGLSQDGADDGDGMGLRTMRARARRIGATFSLDEGDEGGARLQIRLPLTQEFS